MMLLASVFAGHRQQIQSLLPVENMTKMIRNRLAP